MQDQQETISSIESASEPFVGQWRKLVSTSNWEKGRILHEWRTALMEAGAPVTEYSDEAWAQRVGSVTSQHTGRLRRVFDRFHGMREQFGGLYWSHFQAALDWDDAEMWLEGAIQNQWSVALMRRQRWETLGAIEGQKPNDNDIVESELDEDFEDLTEAKSPNSRDDVPFDNSDVSEARSPAGPDFGDEEDVARSSRVSQDDAATEPTAVVRPFANLAELPDDLKDAFESFKLAILRHKSEGWKRISIDNALASLDSLKELATAPSAE